MLIKLDFTEEKLILTIFPLIHPLDLETQLYQLLEAAMYVNKANFTEEKLILTIFLSYVRLDLETQLHELLEFLCTLIKPISL